jgi:hypothetical protein
MIVVCVFMLISLVGVGVLAYLNSLSYRIIHQLSDDVAFVTYPSVIRPSIRRGWCLRLGSPARACHKRSSSSPGAV